MISKSSPFSFFQIFAEDGSARGKKSLFAIMFTQSFSGLRLLSTVFSAY